MKLTRRELFGLGIGGALAAMMGREKVKPTEVLTEIPDGGYALDFESTGVWCSPPLAPWEWVKSPVSTGAVIYTNGAVIYTNGEIESDA